MVVRKLFGVCLLVLVVLYLLSLVFASSLAEAGIALPWAQTDRKAGSGGADTSAPRSFRPHHARRSAHALPCGRLRKGTQDGGEDPRRIAARSCRGMIFPGAHDCALRGLTACSVNPRRLRRTSVFKNFSPCRFCVRPCSKNMTETGQKRREKPLHKMITLQHHNAFIFWHDYCNVMVNSFEKNFIRPGVSLTAGLFLWHPCTCLSL